MRKSFTRLLGLLTLFCVMSISVVAIGSVPTVTLSPIDGFLNVRPDNTNGTVFEMTFDQPVLPGNLGGINSGIVSLNSIAGVQLDPIQITGTTSSSLTTGSTVVIDGNKVTVTFMYDLLEETSYYITVSSDAFKNANNEYFAGISGVTPRGWDFTCGDFTAPKVQITTTGGKQLFPNDNSQANAFPFVLTAIFDENIAKGTGKIGIYTADGAVVEMIDVNSSAVSVLGPTLTVTPTAILKELTEYYVRILPGTITDDVTAYGTTAKANNYAGINTNIGWNFLTADVIAPTVSAFPATTEKAAKNQDFILTFADNNRTGVIFDPKESNQTLSFNLCKNATGIAYAVNEAVTGLTATVTLNAAAGPAVAPYAGTFTYTYLGENKVKVTPSADLPTGSSINIAVAASSLFGNEGNAVAVANFAWEAGDFTAPSATAVITRASNDNTNIDIEITVDDLTPQGYPAASYSSEVKYLISLASAAAPTAAQVWANGSTMDLKSGSTNVHEITGYSGLSSKEDYVLYYVVEDSKDNQSVLNSTAFKTTDTQAPTYTIAYVYDVDNVEPAKVDKNGVITITFDEPIFADATGTPFTATTLAAAFSMSSNGTDFPNFSASISTSNTIVTITPDAGAYGAWNNGAPYTLRIVPNTIYDYPVSDPFYAATTGNLGSSNPITSAAENKFAVEDYQGPIAAFSPANIAVDASVDIKPSVMFDEAVYSENGIALNNDPTSPAWIGNYVFLRAGNSATSPLITNTPENISISDNVVTFTPGTLAPEKDYYVHISNLVQDSFGSKLIKYEDNSTAIAGKQDWATWKTGDNVKPAVTIEATTPAYVSLGNVDIDLAVNPTPLVALNINEGLYFQGNAISGMIDNNMIRPQISLKEGGVNGTDIPFDIESIVADVDDPTGYTDRSIIYLRPINPLETGKTYYAAITGMTDRANNAFPANQTSGTITTKAVPTLPVVTTLFPADGAAAVSIADQKLQISFDRVISQGTYVNATEYVRIFDAADNVLCNIDITLGGVTIANNIATINIPSATPLLANTSYYVQITANAFKDAQGNFFAGIADKTTWNFTTEDKICPTATITPANAATAVSQDFAVEITFSESIEVGSGIITFHTTDGIITGKTQVNVQSPAVTSLASNKIKIVPGQTFAYGAIIGLEIPATAFKDLAGNFYAGLAGSTAHTFTITTNPLITISDWVPADNSDRASLEAPFKITFSEPAKLTNAGRINIWDKADGALAYQVIDLSTAEGRALVSWNEDNTELTISHNILKANTNYEVVIDANVFVDKETGLEFISEISDASNYPDADGWDFTTKDLTAPVATWNYVVGSLAPQDATFVITFDEPIKNADASAITTVNAPALFTLTSSTTGASIPALNAVITEKSISLTPATDLTSEAQYALTLIANSVEDASANELASAVTLNFQVVDKVAPILTLTDAATYTDNSFMVNANLTNETIGSKAFVYLKAVAKGAAAPTVDDVLANGKKFDYALPAAVLPYVIDGLANYTNYDIYGAAIDASGNKSDDVASLLDVWTLDKIAPKLVSVTPANGLQQVDPSMPFELTLTFDEDVIWVGPNANTGATIGTGSIYGLTLREKDSQVRIPISAVTNVAGDNKKLRATTVAVLTQNTEYYVELDYNCINDNPVNTLTAPYSQAANTYAGAFIGKTAWTFKTGDVTGLFLAQDGTVNKLTPRNGATKVNPVAAQRDLILEFDENVKKGTGLIYLYRVGTTTNPLEIIDVESPAVTVNGKIVTIKRNNNLTTGISYYVVVPATAFFDEANTVNEDDTAIGANKFAGLNVAGYTVGDWEFTASDLIAPVASFSSFVPALDKYPASDNLPRTAAIYPTIATALATADAAFASGTVVDDRTVILTLNEAVATAPAFANFTFVKKSDNSSVAFTVNYDATALKAYIQPTVALASEETYVVTLKDAALRDAEGNTVNSQSFEFTTWDEASPIATITPANTTTGVALDSKIIIEMDKAVVRGPSFGAAENMPLTAADLSTFITLTNLNTGAAVSYTPAILEAGKKFELTPNAPLASSNLGVNQRYNVTIAGGTFMKDAVYAPYGNLYTGLDRAGNAANTSTFSTVDVIAPIYVTKVPATTAPLTEVAKNAVLTITFNENVIAGAGKIQIRRANGQLFDEVLASACTYTGATVTIPHRDFEDFTTYYVSIPAGAITDASGNAYAATEFAGAAAYNFWKFCTGDGVDPHVIVYSPVQDAQNVPGEANLVLTFSENVQLVNPGELVIYHNNGDVPIRDDGNVEERINLMNPAQVSLVDNILTVNPTITFDKNGVYYVRFTPNAIQDLAGNNYDGIVDNTTWRFSITDWSPIKLVSVTPTNGASDVDLNSTLTMTFDRDVLAGTGYIKLFEYIYNTSTYAVEERLSFKDVEGFENGIPVTSDNVSISGNTATVSLPGTLRDNVIYYVLLSPASFTNESASDLTEFAGISNPFDWRFTTIADTQLPELASALVDAVSPIDVTCIDKSALELTLTFNEPIMAGAGNIVIYNKADGTVAETIPAVDGTYSNNDPFTATFVPSALEDLTSYYVMVEADAIKDKATASEFPEWYSNPVINYFDSSVIAAEAWSFTTGDVTAPAATFAPVDGSVNVAADIDLVLTFAEEVQLVAEGETAGQIFVTEDGAAEPFFSAAITAEMINVNVVTVPVAGLADNKLYNVTLEANMITDMAGDCGTVRGNEALTTGWSFTTGDNTLPVVTANPEAADAAADTFNVVLTFSETVANVDETTIIVANGSIVAGSLVDNADLTFDVQFTGVDGDTLKVTFADAIVDANNNKLAPAEFIYVIGDNVAPAFVAGLPNTVLGASDGIDLSVTFDDVVAGVAGKNVEIYKVGAIDPILVIDAATFATEDGMTFTTPLTVTENADYFVTIEAGAFVDETAAPKGAAFAGIDDNTTWAFSIWDRTFCTDDITLSPADGTTNLAVSGNELVINFCEPVQLTSSFIVYVAPSDNVTAGFSYTAATVSADGYTVTIPVTDELASATVYTVTVPSFGITDMAGNIFHNEATIYNGGIINGEIWNFTTADVEAPTAVVTPGEGENLSNNFVVKVKFSENVTVPAGAISATGATATVTGADNEYEVALVAEDNAKVVLTLANTIVDAAGNKLATASYTYKVGDNTAPAVSVVTPKGTATDANPVLTMTLDENVVAGAGKLYIYNGAEVAQEFSVSDAAVSISGSTVTITLPESLNKNTEYFVLVDAGFVKDAAGNEFAGINTPATWAFTTGEFQVGVVDLAKAIKVYPTVFSSYINIEVSSDVVLTKAVITNIAGQMIKEVVNPNNTIQTSDLRSGVYFISLHTADGIAKTERIIKR